MTYNMLLKMIEKGSYDKEDLLNKIDTFYANNRITQEQYIELLAKVSNKKEGIFFGEDGAININGSILRVGEIACDKTRVKSMSTHTIGTSSPYQGIL